MMQKYMAQFMGQHDISHIEAQPVIQHDDPQPRILDIEPPAIQQMLAADPDPHHLTDFIGIIGLEMFHYIQDQRVHPLHLSDVFSPNSDWIIMAIIFLFTSFIG